MILAILIMIPLAAGLIVMPAARLNPRLARWLSLVALAIDFALALTLWQRANTMAGTWWRQLDLPWIPQWGARVHLGLDGLSLLLVLLTLFLGMISVLTSWKGISNRVGFYHFNLLWILGGILGVFLSLDLFLFYFFWELMLIPMYFLIGIWGYERRVYAALKFFIFTQASGLLMLLSILGLYFIHAKATGVATFDYVQLLKTPLDKKSEMLLLLGFFAAFAVKLPVVPFHTWLPDAHTEAPTAGSVILAGLLLKTGGYGLIRFILPFFPGAAHRLAPLAMALAVIGIIYGGVLAYGQKDLKRLVAYTSVSHMGFVLLGVFAGTPLALQGAVIQILCHGLSTGGLFILVGSIQERLHTRDLENMGGFWAWAPKMGSSGLFFALASLGLPGLGNFVGEFLTLIGTYQVSTTFGILASLGFVVSVIYSLWLVQAVFQGTKKSAMKESQLPDLSYREILIMAALMIGLVWIGILPQPLINEFNGTATEVLNVYH